MAAVSKLQVVTSNGVTLSADGIMVIPSVWRTPFCVEQCDLSCTVCVKSHCTEDTILLYKMVTVHSPGNTMCRTPFWRANWHPPCGVTGHAPYMRGHMVRSKMEVLHTLGISHIQCIRGHVVQRTPSVLQNGILLAVWGPGKKYFIQMGLCSLGTPELWLFGLVAHSIGTINL